VQGVPVVSDDVVLVVTAKAHKESLFNRTAGMKIDCDELLLACDDVRGITGGANNFVEIDIVHSESLAGVGFGGTRDEKPA